MLLLDFVSQIIGIQLDTFEFNGIHPYFEEILGKQQAAPMVEDRRRKQGEPVRQ